MATDTDNASPTTESPTSLNAQDFSDSDDEILDNFADGPPPTDSRETDQPQHDGTPMGLGGEKEKQSEPAETPPEDTAGEPEPVQEPAGETGTETSPAPTEEPETPEFPPVLLQMAGYADADAAKADGLSTPEALHAFIRGRGQLLTPGTQPAQPSEQGLYRRPAQPPATPSRPAPETVVEPEETGDVKSFELPDELVNRLDEDLVGLVRGMNDHYENLNAGQQKELQSLRAELRKRDEALALQQGQDEEAQFDEVLNNLGKEWRDVFGEGSGVELARAGHNDPVAMTNFNHRSMLFDAVGTVREVNAKQGGKPMTLEQETQWALMQRYPDKFQQSISGNSNSPGPRRGVTASRPTQRNTPPSAKDKLLRDLHKKFPDGGFTRQDEDEFDGEI
ncbi:MAG: hypothetical protein ACYSWO_30095 [Planctomycetota bacterium]|jgi:hypothetical protein